MYTLVDVAQLLYITLCMPAVQFFKSYITDKLMCLFSFLLRLLSEVFINPFLPFTGRI